MYPSVEYVVYVIEHSAGQSPAMSFISAMSVIVALCALYFSVQHIRDERKHKILMVQPKVIIQIDSPLPGKRGLTLSIVNCGLGPAILNKIEYSINERLIQDPFVRLSLLMKYDTDQTFIFNSPAKEQYIAPQQVYPLAQSDCDMHQAETVKNRMREALDIRITYSSIYGEQFVTAL